MQLERTTRLLLGTGLLLALGTGCGDETTEPPVRLPRSYTIPTGVSLEYAAAEAIPGDTLLFVSGVLVAETITFESGQTPLLLVSSKGTATNTKK